VSNRAWTWIVLVCALVLIVVVLAILNTWMTG
jgi:hypothetical protein